MKRLQADSILLFVSVVWGMAFVAQRTAAPLVGIWWFNGARFILAGTVLAPLIFRRRFENISPQSTGLVLITSLVLAAASGLQQAGLQFTSAANAGFITSLYVVLVPVLGMLLFRRKTRLSAWLSAVIAVTGVMLLSMGGGTISFVVGDFLEFLGAVLWAVHLILVDRVVKQVEVLTFATFQYFIVGVVQLVLGGLFESASLVLLKEVIWAVVYTGLVSIAIGYTLQAYAQKQAPPVDAAIILSMESVFAALGGYLLLGEALLPIQLVGCGLILMAVITAQVSVYLPVIGKTSRTD